MKTTLVLLSLLSFLTLTNKSFSQGEAAVPFLTFPVSPSQTGMGSTGTSLPIDDPFGLLLNPAQLGYTSQTQNLSFSFYPSKAKLWGFEEFSINSFAINLGYSLNDIIGLPLSFGMGFNKTSFSFEEPNIPSSFIEDNSFQAISLGVGIDYYIQFNAGITFKNIKSKISNYEADLNAIDYGLLLNVPITKLINEQLALNVFENNPLYPYLNLSFGYSQSNIGDEIYYVDPSQNDPLPRTARLGYGISVGMDSKINESTLNIIGFDFTVDAEDRLLEYEYLNSGNPVIPNSVKFKGYQSFIGDINIGKNIFQIKGDDKVLTRAGFQVNVLDFFTYRRGHLSGDGYNNVVTNGYEIKAGGILKLISRTVSNNMLKLFTNNFDLRYSYSNYQIESGFETKFHGISLYVHNLNSLF